MKRTRFRLLDVSLILSLLASPSFKTVLAQPTENQWYSSLGQGTTLVLQGEINFSPGHPRVIYHTYGDSNQFCIFSFPRNSPAWNNSIDKRIDQAVSGTLTVKGLLDETSSTVSDNRDLIRQSYQLPLAKLPGLSPKLPGLRLSTFSGNEVDLECFKLARLNNGAGMEEDEVFYPMSIGDMKKNLENILTLNLAAPLRVSNDKISGAFQLAGNSF